jgi:hypothetical protein
MTQQYPASRISQRVVSYMIHVFSCSRFAHHYSGNHIRFLFLTLLRCFSSGRCLLMPYIFRHGCTESLCTGSPIRTSSDQCMIDCSPRLNAAFHVLLRLLMPRHPPKALFNYSQILFTTVLMKFKM